MLLPPVTLFRSLCAKRANTALHEPSPASKGTLVRHLIRMDGSITLGTFGWDHETDARPWVANGVRDLIARYASGLLLDASK